MKKDGVPIWPFPSNVVIKFCRSASDRICSLIVILRAVQSWRVMSLSYNVADPDLHLSLQSQSGPGGDRQEELREPSACVEFSLFSLNIVQDWEVTAVSAAPVPPVADGYSKVFFWYPPCSDPCDSCVIRGRGLSHPRSLAWSSESRVGV